MGKSRSSSGSASREIEAFKVKLHQAKQQAKGLVVRDWAEEAKRVKESAHHISPDMLYQVLSVRNERLPGHPETMEALLGVLVERGGLDQDAADKMLAEYGRLTGKQPLMSTGDEQIHGDNPAQVIEEVLRRDGAGLMLVSAMSEVAIGDTSEDGVKMQRLVDEFVRKGGVYLISAPFDLEGALSISENEYPLAVEYARVLKRAILRPIRAIGDASRAGFAAAMQFDHELRPEQLLMVQDVSASERRALYVPNRNTSSAHECFVGIWVDRADLTASRSTMVWIGPKSRPSTALDRKLQDARLNLFAAFNSVISRWQNDELEDFRYNGDTLMSGSGSDAPWKIIASTKGARP